MPVWVTIVNLAYALVFGAASFTMFQWAGGIYSKARRSCAQKFTGTILGLDALVALFAFAVPIEQVRYVYIFIAPSLTILGTAGLLAVLRHERQLGDVAVKAIRKELALE